MFVNKENLSTWGWYRKLMPIMIIITVIIRGRLTNDKKEWRENDTTVLKYAELTVGTANAKLAFVPLHNLANPSWRFLQRTI